MTRFLPFLGVAGALAAASPTQATEWMYCNDAQSTVTVGLLLGSMDTLAVSGIVLSHNDRVWASHTAYGPGEEVSMGQGFENESMMMVDLMDKDFVLLAQLRLMKASEGADYAVAGTLRMPGAGAWTVTCEGP